MVTPDLNSINPLREIIESLMQYQLPTQEDLAFLKKRIAAKYRMKGIPSNSDLIQALTIEEKVRLLHVLKRKTTRTISGVTVVAVMTKPNPCPQPEPCAYCPGGPRLGVPQSYTGFEPASMRGIQNKYDPYLQVRTRTQQLEAIGHEVDKIELIIMGGTFPATPAEYQAWFIQRCLDAITEQESSSLAEAKKNAETSRIRNVGITVETRPDWAKKTHVDRMLDMGVTRVEMGVQNPSDEIYNLVGRTHSVQDVVEATQVTKDAGLKVAYHMMPGLPGSNREKDLEAFKTIFNNDDFRPDMIKIYPCLVLKETKAYRWYSKGAYQPYTNEQAADLIVEIKKIVPSWIRIMRVQRDIPASLIVAGVNKSNLRQIAQKRLAQEHVKCRCIRCREIGHRTRDHNTKVIEKEMNITTTRYGASEGEEIFISAEAKESDSLIGYLRLRIPSDKVHRVEIIAEPCSIVRELHIYGSLAPVGKHLVNAWQHKGCGTILLTQAEQISREDYDLRKVLVISGLGTKQYYKRLGYSYDGVYMSKNLDELR